MDELLDGLAGLANTGAGPVAKDLLIEALYSQPFLRSEVFRVVMRDADAEEALQETLLAIAQGLSGFRGDAKLRTWARRIARNCAIAQLRRRRDEVGFAGDVAEDPGEIARFSSVLAARTDIRLALEALPSEFREVVRLRDVEHLSYAEIAAELDLKLNTVRSRLARGRARMADILAES